MLVYEKPSPSALVFKGFPSRQFYRKIFLAIDGQHCFLIVDIRGYMNKEICVQCFKFYPKNSRRPHICEKTCVGMFHFLMCTNM